jgi:hypothetical protein
MKIAFALADLAMKLTNQQSTCPADCRMADSSWFRFEAFALIGAIDPGLMNQPNFSIGEMK